MYGTSRSADAVLLSGTRAPYNLMSSFHITADKRGTPKNQATI